MTYIIDDAYLLKGQQTIKTSMLIDGGRIISARPSFPRYNHIRMSAEPFIMTPTHVLLDYNLLLERSFQERKDYYIDNFIMKGSMTVLAAVKIQSENEFEAKIKEAVRNLIDCPLDYILGIMIPPSLLKPSFIRKCKRAKIPATFIDISDPKDLAPLPWGWVKEALFPYNSLLIPVFGKELSNKEKQFHRKSWIELMAKEGIHASDELEEMVPLPKKILMRTGIYPLKANLISGSEVSYNLYHKTRESIGLCERELFQRHANQLVVTVNKGKIIRAGNKVYFRPGDGENVIINTPGFFTG